MLSKTRIRNCGGGKMSRGPVYGSDILELAWYLIVLFFFSTGIVLIFVGFLPWFINLIGG